MGLSIEEWTPAGPVVHSLSLVSPRVEMPSGYMRERPLPPAQPESGVWSAFRAHRR